MLGIFDNIWTAVIGIGVLLFIIRMGFPSKRRIEVVEERPMEPQRTAREHLLRMPGRLREGVHIDAALEDLSHAPEWLQDPDMEVVKNEEWIWCEKPVPLYGRVDQVFRSRRTGECFILDTKTVSRVPRAEREAVILQLSIYRIILEEEMGEGNVSPIGVIRYVAMDGDGRTRTTYVSVPLLGRGEVLERIETARRLKNLGRAAA